MWKGWPIGHIVISIQGQLTGVKSSMILYGLEVKTIASALQPKFAFFSFYSPVNSPLFQFTILDGPSTNRIKPCLRSQDVRGSIRKRL